MSVKEDLKKEFEIGKIKEGRPTFGQILGAGLFAAVARKNPGMAKGALQYQEDADEYNKYIEEKKEKAKARNQKLIESRRNTLLGLLPSMKFGEALTPEYQAEINEIMSNYGEEDGKLLLEAYKVNPASASEFYTKLKKQQAELGGRVSGVELGSLLKASIVPGKAAKFKNINEALNFALGVNVGDTADYTRGLYELTQGGATAGGVSFDASAIANQFKPEAIKLQDKMIDNEVIKQTRLQIANPNVRAGLASDLEAYLKDYATGGKEQLYAQFGGEAILKLVQNTQGFGSAALRYNPKAQNLWNQAGYAIPRGDVYFNRVKKLKNKLATLTNISHKQMEIESFENTFGPGSAARAGIFN